MDMIDRKILDLLQRDADIPVADIAEEVGLSATPCWKRIKKLRSSGIIDRKVMMLNAERLGLPLTGYVRLSCADHSEDWLNRFMGIVEAIPEVQECHRMAGEVDYFLKIVCSSMGDYDRIYKQLIKAGNLSDVSVSFSMECVKSTTALPLPS